MQWPFTVTAYAEAVTVGDDDLRRVERRSLLAKVMDHLRTDTPLSALLGQRLDAVRVNELLGPAAEADCQIDWLGVNGERVDAVVTAGESQWRVVFGSASGATIDWLEVYARPRRFDGVTGGHAVVINGPSGSGKSVLMRALQQVAVMPFVIFDEPEQLGTVQPEYLIWRDRAPALHRGYLEAIGALARAGNHVAVPAAGHGQAEFDQALDGVPMVTVGLKCASHVLTERERRSGRWGGIAAESTAIHNGWNYDVEFDTTDEPDPLRLAQRVLDRIDPPTSP